MFEFSHRVQFYETDLMGIVHHSNYLRLFEEARVAWGVQAGLLEWSKPETASAFAVLSTQVRHLKPSRFGDVLKIQVQARLSGVRIEFAYKMWNDQELISEARTEHVHLGPDLKVLRPSAKMKQQMEKEQWNETWLSNL